MPETLDLGTLMEAFKTMAQMNLFEDQPGMHWGLKIFMGVMIILLIVCVSMLFYWWATNQKNFDTPVVAPPPGFTYPPQHAGRPKRQTKLPVKFNNFELF